MFSCGVIWKFCVQKCLCSVSMSASEYSFSLFALTMYFGVVLLVPMSFLYAAKKSFGLWWFVQSLFVSMLQVCECSSMLACCSCCCMCR